MHQYKQVCNKLKDVAIFVLRKEDLLAMAETEINSFFHTLWYLLQSVKTHFQKRVSPKRGILLVYVNSDIS